MFQFQTPFDARTVEPASFLPPPPLADYHVRIEDSEAKPTAKQDGGYLQLMLEILDPGQYLGRKVPYNLNLFNINPTTVEIAYKQLSAICHVTGVFNVQDSRQLHNIPFIATIGPQSNNPQYSNVFGVKDLSGNVPGKHNAAPPPVAAAPAQPAWQPGPPAAAAQPAWTPPGATPPPAPVWQPPPGAAPPPAAAAPAPPWAQAPAAVALPAAPPWAQPR